MTYEEVLNGIKQECDICQTSNNCVEDECIWFMCKEVINKQIPKKPIDDFRYKPKICPSCHAFLKEYQNFCDNCGQKIEWGD